MGCLSSIRFYTGLDLSRRPRSRSSDPLQVEIDRKRSDSESESVPVTPVKERKNQRESMIHKLIFLRFGSCVCGTVI